MNLIEKALAEKSKMDIVKPGDRINVEPTLVFSRDESIPKVIADFEDAAYKKVIHPEKVIFFTNHHASVANYEKKQQDATTKEFCRRHGLHLYDWDNGEIHQLLAKKWNIQAQKVVAGVDRYVSTFGAFGVIAFSISPFTMSRYLGEGAVKLSVPETIYIEISGTLQQEVTARDVSIHLLRHFNVDGLSGYGVVIGGDTLKRMSPDDRMMITHIVRDMGGEICVINQQGPMGQVEMVIKILAEEIAASGSNPLS